jgi:hypothetical protein
LVVVDTILEQDNMIKVLGVTKPENYITKSPIPTIFMDSIPISMDSLPIPKDYISETSIIYFSSEPEVIYYTENTNYTSNGTSWILPGRDSYAPHEAVEPVE